MLWLLLAMGSATVFSADYQQDAEIGCADLRQDAKEGHTDYLQVFGDDWKQAAQYVNQHHEEWTETFRLFGVEARLAEAIIFPELIRYSKWQDQIEQLAVNGLYVTRGKEANDFSIGRFQMKPSFAEEVEREWNHSALAQEYGFSFNLQQNAAARRSRIRRLSTTEGQCRYLAIFIRLLQLRHPQLLQLTKEEQVRFLATAYNRSFTAPWSEILQKQYERHYHTDVIRTSSTQLHCYADISVAAFSMLPKK